MSICPKCKVEYIKGKRICSFCGEELYKGLLTGLSEDEKIFTQLEWSKVTNVNTETEAELILKQLVASNIPAIRRDTELPFEDVSTAPNSSIDIYVPDGFEDSAIEVIN